MYAFMDFFVVSLTIELKFNIRITNLYIFFFLFCSYLLKNLHII